MEAVSLSLQVLHMALNRPGWATTQPLILGHRHAMAHQHALLGIVDSGETNFGTTAKWDCFFHPND